MAQEAINATLQTIIVLIIAVVWWAIFGRKKANFARYIGLIAPTPRAMLWSLGLTCILAPLTIGIFMLPALRGLGAGEHTVSGMLRAQGPSWDVIGQIAIIAFIKTALSEEIFFRGLIAKRLIGRLGFGVGNTLHAALFGSVHLIIFAIPGGPPFDPAAAAALFAVTGAGGWVMAWLNERAGNGSIAPSWLLHGLSNAIAYPVLAFW